MKDGKNELVLNDERLRVTKGDLECFLDYPNHRQATAYSKKMISVADKDIDVITGVTKEFLVELGMSEKLFEKLSHKDIQLVQIKLKGEEVSEKN